MSTAAFVAICVMAAAFIGFVIFATRESGYRERRKDNGDGGGGFVGDGGSSGYDEAGGFTGDGGSFSAGGGSFGGGGASGGWGGDGGGGDGGGGGGGD